MCWVCFASKSYQRSCAQLYGSLSIDEFESEGKLIQLVNVSKANETIELKGYTLLVLSKGETAVRGSFRCSLCIDVNRY